MMGGLQVILTLAVVILMNVAVSHSAPSGKSSIVPRDTDEISALRAKLSRLNELLSAVEEEEETDLKNVAQQQHKSEVVDTPATPAISETMGLDRRTQGEQSDKKEVQAELETEPDAVLPGRGDDSLEILSKALAKLREPSYKSEDSTGEYLAKSDDGGEEEDNENDKEMEEMIARALARLRIEKLLESQGRPQPGASRNEYDVTQDGGYGGNNNGYDTVDKEDSVSLLQPSREEDELRREAIRVVETRLMQDIILANKLGISVEDLIQDLDDKAYREAKLKQFERQLDVYQKENLRY